MNRKPKAYKVKVGELKDTGKHDSPWIITWPTNAHAKKTLGSITFDPTKPDVWVGKSPPVKGEFLVVDDVREKPGGWNAHNVRYFRTEDLDDPDIIQ